MRLQSYPSPRLVFSCTHSLVPTPFAHVYTNNSSSILVHPPMLPQTQIHPPLKIPTLPHQPNTLKDICLRGNLKEAFRSLSVSFNDYPDEIYAPVLELCANKKALSQGLQIHAHVIKSWSVSESVFLGTKLVFMYGKCGSIENAEQVFDQMGQRSIFTWNAMIGAYVSNGEPLGALETYKQMRVLGVSLDAYTFPSLLKASSLLKNLRLGTEIHGLAVKFGCSSTVFVANSLVAMYAKCDDLYGARRLFKRMAQKNDVVSWNSIVSAYAANGKSMEALKLFREMQKAGLDRNTYTFVASLQACADYSFRKLGMEIHAAVLKSTQHLDVYVANALISMYVRCCKMSEAVRIFNELDEKDKVSRNSMLTGFIQNGMYHEAMYFFHDFLNAGQKPDQVTIISILVACGRLGYLLNGRELHAHAIKYGFDFDLQVGNTLIDMYAKCGCVNHMGRAFDRMPYKDIISWTTIIAGYAQNNYGLKAFESFREVQLVGMDADPMMIGSLLLACSEVKCVSQVKEIHGYIMRRGLSDVVLENTIIDVYGECGNIDYAVQTFELIKFKDVVSWTSMISACVRNGLANEALKLFHIMNKTGIQPDSVALISLLSGASNLSGLKNGKEIHSFVIRKGFILEGSIASSLVDMYSHCGMVENAYKVFKSVQNKGLVLWTSMINSYGMHGHGKAAIDLFNKMKENLTPDHVTFLAVLYACSHSGLIDEGRRVFEIMKYEYQLEPWTEHYACLVDLLGRANCLEEAYEIVESMQMEPTAEIWCALLGACQVHSNKELGEIAAHKLLELDPKNPGHYVLISNVFAARGRCKDAEEIRTRMKERGLKKNPGCSWIEVGNRIHTFMARDKSHPECLEINKKLDQVTKKLEKEGGYVAQTKFVLHNVEENEKVIMLYGHSERLAIAYGLLRTAEGTPIRITKNLRICGDCHTFCKLVSGLFGRELVVRDANRFHHFEGGVCSCGDFW
ncbi:PREDICTED: pentatricopeptide repeat-containing protein At3g63370, chloroplastic [Theobroma cacao]|uniref:Pentatricopeptide repeat-containing protein At3g63370, chloroplastic n=1 Tax=Theobroma cacao TaxID=3641 RepID=A0AB32VV71_THECC|nr:PREDICTED: pentatricopeptide repeat-containing protein At3g63370, chloroplastic [Theobroma cacao]